MVQVGQAVQLRDDKAELQAELDVASAYLLAAVEEFERAFAVFVPAV